MKVLSLLQPWASALFIPVPGRTPQSAAKEWETRSWKPSEKNQQIIRRDGLLIHASLGWKPAQTKLLRSWPFEDYMPAGTMLRLGHIIGVVTVGEILMTEQWKGRYYNRTDFEEAERYRYKDEFHLGNYNPKRWAWHFPTYHLFEKPIETRGALSLWDYYEPIPELNINIL